jgi:GDP-4-dehydro-6-deoxy-D-mannose reductase
LADLLLEKGFDIYGTTYKNGIKNIEHLKDRIKIIKCDIANGKEIEKIVNKAKPDYVFHLAAQSFVIPSWKNPEETFKANIFGTFYLLEAIKNAKINPVIGVACSSAEYGLTYKNEIPISEKKEFSPSSPYEVSKVTTDMLAYMYWQTYKMNIFRLRFFNISGPRKTFDACSDFAKGIAEIEKGIKDTLEVGNTEGIRDITDVRDAVKAMWIISEKGKPGDVYNICSGKGYRIKDIINKLISFSSSNIKIIQNSEKLRLLDDPVFIGDNSKIRKLGWKPEIPIEKTLKDMLEYWRNKLY